MKKLILMLLVVMVFGQFRTEAAILVNYTGNVVDSAGVGVPNGNQVRLGFFNASFDVVAAAQAGNWSGTLANWHDFSSTTTDPTKGIPNRAGNFAESPSQDGTGFIGQPIYLWAFKTTTDLPPTSWGDVMEYGVFINPSNPNSNWTFPADLGDTSVASDNLGVVAYQGHGGIWSGSLQLAAIPEPGTFVVATGVGLLLFSICRKLAKGD
jgi:hypothetical protein